MTGDLSDEDHEYEQTDNDRHRFPQPAGGKRSERSNASASSTGVRHPDLAHLNTDDLDLIFEDEEASSHQLSCVITVDTVRTGWVSLVL